MEPARYVRLYAHEDGESHFEDGAVPLAPVDFAPPAPPLYVGQLFPAAHCFFLAAAVDWGGERPHPAPRRQLLCMLRGCIEVTASDGETRRFETGELLLLEDTIGKGHASRVVGDEPVVMLGVVLVA